MSESLTVGRLTTGTVIKLLLIGSIVPLSILCAICGIAGMLGAATVKLNDRPVHGIAALVVGVVMGPIMSIAFSLFGGLMVAIGLWIYSWKSKLTISYHP